MTVVNMNAERAKALDDNRLLSPVDCLKDAIRTLEDGEPCHSLMVISLDKGDDDKDYRVGYWASHLSSSEMLSLLETAKIAVLQQMNIIKS